jgi:hypothetical protein
MKSAVTMLAATLALAFTAVTAKADTTETTTVRTTTTSLDLPSSSSYIVVDPNTGVARGAFDPTTRLLDGRPLPMGYYVVDQPTGKVMATVDGSGNLVGFTSVPSVLPNHFVVMNNQVVYFESDYSLRRAQLEARIDEQYKLGHLTNDQVKNLKQDISEITTLQTKTKSDGTMKESTRKQIERKFADVQAVFDRDIAKINDKRAKIGLKTD